MQYWAHNPEERPSFTEIVRQIPKIMPQRLVSVTSCCDGIIDHLQYSKSETIIVLNKCPPTYPDGYFWRRYMRNGRTGLFRPEETVAKLAIELANNKCDKYVLSFTLSAYFHEKQRTQDKNSRKKLLINESQGVHHTYHVRVDGAAFGLLQFGKNDISIKSSATAH
ncbi:Ack-related non-receptor tyrosine kinase [Dirofilaria immitis]